VLHIVNEALQEAIRATIRKPLLPVTLSDTDRARKWIAQEGGIGVRDAIHGAVMLNNGITTIASLDETFDGIRGLKRLALT
jgi:predicted nucleic acid-binding protein